MGWEYGSASLSHLPVPHCPGRLCPHWAFRMGHVRSPVLSQHLRSSSSPCPPPTPAIYTDPHTLSWPAPLTPAEHDLLSITGAQEGAARACAWRGSWLCVCMCVCACTCVSLCACVHACVRTCVCLSLYVCVCVRMYVCMCAGAWRLIQAHRTLSPAAVRQQVLNEGRLCWPSPTQNEDPLTPPAFLPNPSRGSGKKETHYRQ